MDLSFYKDVTFTPNTPVDAVEFFLVDRTATKATFKDVTSDPLYSRTLTVTVRPGDVERRLRHKISLSLIAPFAVNDGTDDEYVGLDICRMEFELPADLSYAARIAAIRNHMDRLGYIVRNDADVNDDVEDALTYAIIPA
jgi:hypothetical protein